MSKPNSATDSKTLSTAEKKGIVLGALVSPVAGLFFSWLVSQLLYELLKGERPYYTSLEQAQHHENSFVVQDLKLFDRPDWGVIYIMLFFAYFALIVGVPLVLRLKRKGKKSLSAYLVVAFITSLFGMAITIVGLAMLSHPSVILWTIGSGITMWLCAECIPRYFQSSFNE